VLPAWLIQAGLRSSASSSTASGTCSARPDVAIVGPAQEQAHEQQVHQRPQGREQW
jgi:hypothetical protein